MTELNPLFTMPSIEELADKLTELNEDPDIAMQITSVSAFIDILDTVEAPVSEDARDILIQSVAEALLRNAQ